MSLLFFFSVDSQAGDSLGVSANTIIRSQLQSLANEVVEQAKFDSCNRVNLWIEGDEPRSLAENAFTESLQKKNIQAILKTDTASEWTLHIFLLESTVAVQKIDTLKLTRDIRTVLEARTIKGKEREVHLLGTFQREMKDTAQVFPSAQISGGLEGEQEGGFQKLLTPLIVISGAILIVYLLFTVRS